MIDHGKSIEALHRRHEERSDLADYTLCLGDHRHRVKLPENGTLEVRDQSYLLQQASSLRWIIGPGTFSLNNHPAGQKLLDEASAENGALSFETKLFDFPKTAPPELEKKDRTGAATLFLDLGGSSIKGALFSNEQLSRQLSISWEPFTYRSMEAIVQPLETFLLELLGERPSDTIYHVGISCAGLCQNGALVASTLVQGLTNPPDLPHDPWFLKRLIHRLFPCASYELFNDGAVTALPFQKGHSFGERRTISLVMGSNLGGGFYPANDRPGVHELGFLPCFPESKEVEEWSQYHGIASLFFSKQGLLRLARSEELNYPHAQESSEREIIDQLHTDLRHGLKKARLIFQTMGSQLADFITYLERFYSFEEVLLSGGILSEKAVDEMRVAYQTRYHDLNQKPSPALRMLIVPGVLPEFNQVWSLALHHFASQSS